MPQGLVERFRNVARRQPEAAALAWRGARWTYEDLDRAIRSVRACLLGRALGSGARVALLSRNSPQYVALYYGVLASGCVAVPLNVQERASVLARQIKHAEAALVFADPGHPEWAQLSASLQQEGIAHVLVPLHEGNDGAALLAHDLGHQPAATPDASVGVQDLAVILYTSGTTGQPKGVMLSHGNLVANTLAIIDYLALSASDRGLCLLPFHFSYGSSVLNSHLLAGAQLILEDNFAFPHVTLGRMQSEAVTGFAGVPSTFALLLGRCKFADFDLRALRYVTQAGGAMPRPAIERLRRELPHTKLFVMYGQTEATARLTYLAPESLDAKLGSVGKPLVDVEIRVVDASGNELPPREIGEICARGPNIMLGYWRDPAASAETLRDGWLHTGDLGHQDEDGFLYIDGRAVEMIKVGAFRVNPQEVEEVIAALDSVEEVAVTSIADEVLGQAIKAVIVPRAGVEPDLLATKAHCRQHLAAYKVPKVIEFASALPRTASGKIQRFKLT